MRFHFCFEMIAIKSPQRLGIELLVDFYVFAMWNAQCLFVFAALTGWWSSRTCQDMSCGLERLDFFTNKLVGYFLQVVHSPHFSAFSNKRSWWAPIQVWCPAAVGVWSNCPISGHGTRGGTFKRAATEAMLPGACEQWVACRGSCDGRKGSNKCLRTKINGGHGPPELVP